MTLGIILRYYHYVRKITAGLTAGVTTVHVSIIMELADASLSPDGMPSQGNLSSLPNESPSLAVRKCRETSTPPQTVTTCFEMNLIDKLLQSLAASESIYGKDQIERWSSISLTPAAAPLTNLESPG